MGREENNANLNVWWMWVEDSHLTLLLWQVPHYMAAQYLGALAGSGLVFLVYWDALVW